MTEYLGEISGSSMLLPGGPPAPPKVWTASPALAVAKWPPESDPPLIPISFTKHTETEYPSWYRCQPWPETVAMFREFSSDPYLNKKAAPLFSPTFFVEDTRSHRNSTQAAMVVLDGEHVASTADVVDALRSALGVEAVVYTSASNRESDPHWRLLLPIPLLIDRHSYSDLAKAIRRVLESILGEKSIDPTKLHCGDLFYVPGSYAGAINEFHHIEGDILSPEQWIALADRLDPKPPLPDVDLTMSGHERTEYDGELDGDDVIAAVEATTNDIADRDKWIAYGAAIFSALGSGGKSLFVDFTNRRTGGHNSSPREVEQDINKVWSGFSTSGARSTVGTIFWLIRQQDPDWERPSVTKRRQERAEFITACAGSYDAGRPLHKLKPGAKWFAAMGETLEDMDMNGRGAAKLHRSAMQNASQPLEPALPADARRDYADDDPFFADDYADRAGLRPLGLASASGNVSSDTPSRPRTRKYFDEYENDPEIEYWDDDKRLPKMKGGYGILVLGKRESHKTGIVSQITLDGVIDRGARAIYVPCEGEGFFGKLRMPAYCAARGLHVRDLRERFECVPEGINLAEPGVADRFIADHTDFHPDIVIIDTLAQATPGISQNDKAMGDILGLAGPIRKIRNAFDCIVFLVVHPSLADEERPSGTSYQQDNTEMMLLVKHDGKGQITVTTTRYKDGEVGTKLYYSVNLTGVPVPTRIDEPATTKPLGLQPRDADSDWFSIIVHKLAENGIGDVATSWSTGELGERLTPPGDDFEERKAATIKRLHNTIHRKASIDPESFYNRVVGCISRRGKSAKVEWRWWDKELCSPTCSGAESPEQDPTCSDTCSGLAPDLLRAVIH